jgi:hypothetical protein
MFNEQKCLQNGVLPATCSSAVICFKADQRSQHVTISHFHQKQTLTVSHAGKYGWSMLTQWGPVAGSCERGN